MKRLWVVLGVFVLTASFMGSRALYAEEAVSDKRLDAVLEKQDRILKSLQELKDELQVVKIRVSNN